MNDTFVYLNWFKLYFPWELDFYYDSVSLKTECWLLNILNRFLFEYKEKVVTVYLKDIFAIFVASPKKVIMVAPGEKNF